MNIVNFKNLAKNSLRKKALLIAEAGYEAIDIKKIVQKEIAIHKEILNIKGQRINLSDFGGVFLVGIGKGSAIASVELAKILKGKLTKGIAIDVIKPKLEIRNLKLEILTGTHPLPSKQNINATQKIIKLAKGLKKDDLFITFICGGGSALACANKKELRGEILATKKLTGAGANIIELNTVRKHLPGIKGGDLAKMAYPATIISLIASDVLGNDLSMVASGLTVFDKTTKKDAERIIKKYLHKSTLIRALTETPKDKKYFRKVKNFLFVSNQEPIGAMVKKAKKLGLAPKIYSLKLKGEAKNSLRPIIKKIRRGQIILAAGETTVTLKSPIANSQFQKLGKGGRNMEAVLGAIPQTKNLVVLSFASDGRDNTEAAGAIADSSTIIKAQKSKLNPQEYLDRHDSFNFFKKTGDLIFAQQKTFNVSDLMIILKI